MFKKQRQEAGDNSQQIQAGIVIINSGIDEMRGRDIVNEKIDNELINNINKLYERVCQVFDEHNVPLQQIPKFIDSVFDVKYSDLQSKTDFIKKLNPQLIDWICETFSVNKDWIENRCDFIYKTIDVYKYPESFRNLILKIIKDNDIVINYQDNIDVYIFKEDVEYKGDDTGEESYVQFIIRVKIKSVNDTSIYKYYVIRNNLYWNYWKCRRDSKIIIAICKGLAINVHGFTLEHDILERLGAGCEFPEKLISKCYRYTWYPEDYVDNFKLDANEKNDYALNGINLKEIVFETREIIKNLKEDYYKK